MSHLEDTLAYHLKALGAPEPEREYKFHPSRKWRFDFAYPDDMLGIECEGGVYSRGRHVRGEGYEGDLDKYNAASLLGWRILRYTAKKIESGEAAQEIIDARKVKV